MTDHFKHSSPFPRDASCSPRFWKGQPLNPHCANPIPGASPCSLMPPHASWWLHSLLYPPFFRGVQWFPIPHCVSPAALWEFRSQDTHRYWVGTTSAHSLLLGLYGCHHQAGSCPSNWVIRRTIHPFKLSFLGSIHSKKVERKTKYWVSSSVGTVL